jgi:hypothetical protein
MRKGIISLCFERNCKSPEERKIYLALNIRIQIAVYYMQEVVICPCCKSEIVQKTSYKRLSSLPEEKIGLSHNRLSCFWEKALARKNPISNEGSAFWKRYKHETSLKPLKRLMPSPF